MMSDGPDGVAKKIERKRPIRSGGGSSVITIPPIVFEFTEFGKDDEVELEADIGGDEIILRQSDEPSEN